MLQPHPLRIRLVVEFLGTFARVTVAAASSVISHYVYQEFVTTIWSGRLAGLPARQGRALARRRLKAADVAPPPSCPASSWRRWRA